MQRFKKLLESFLQKFFYKREFNNFPKVRHDEKLLESFFGKSFTKVSLITFQKLVSHRGFR